VRGVVPNLELDGGADVVSTETFGRWLTRMRLQAGLVTQAALRDALGTVEVKVSANTISKWETDQVRPSREHLESLILVVGASEGEEVAGRLTWSQPTKGAP
jgi:transcriptional regulator with XRE-family HTH domain